MDRPLVPFGKPRTERADAARNRERLLDAARRMIAEHGVEQVTMDGLAERAELGKGTVFRRFGTRAGIFKALIEADEHRFQAQVLSGPPPLGPGADPVPRLVAFGRARIAFLLEHRALARAAMEPGQPLPGGDVDLTALHLRVLLAQADPDLPNPDGLAIMLKAALEGPPLMFLASEPPRPLEEVKLVLGEGWRTLIERLLS
ncbi:TetR/AcrR family transcriptional regulator [Glycomyces paridis]|uniref:TetR/AcrR family transcriptional regulator n=1 Tax=Glycomyces paridis TaxID=2126555 RepID=A0A4S8P0W7_9ACTN|nr:TetR/AcrR family transcriptional regulator [Glycomyces paridis]THV23627.1 TetR/AcrR family transcriptional regulator [Glycomyces paridis]